MNENMNVPPYAYQGAPNYMPRKPKRIFTALESIFAWLCLFVGYIFCRVFPVDAHPMGGFLFIVALFAVTVVVMLRKGCRLRPLRLLVALSALALSVGLIISANAFLHFFIYLYALAAYCYFVYAMGENALKSGFSDLLVIDFLKALFVLPFCSFGQLFRAMFTGKAKGSGNFIAKALLGIFAALIPTSIVLGLLSYDSGFSALMKNLLDFKLVRLFSHFGSLLFGIPVAMYVFGLFVSSVDQKAGNVMTAERCTKTAQDLRIVPTVTATAALLPPLCVYVVFFISQWRYYLSGFTGVLPADFSYAEYAREGFFQLCTVSVINLLMLVAAVLFMRRKDNRPPAALKILAVIYSLFTLVLISTAVAKMAMYISCHGLTQKRVYATWLMGVLAIIFILVALRQFVPKLNAVAASFAVCVVLFSVLALSNVDARIARYNVDRYIDGSLETVDMIAMDRLGDAAIPELVRLYEVLQQNDSDSSFYKEVTELLGEKANLCEEQDAVFSQTLPRIRAKKALHRIGML